MRNGTSGKIPSILLALIIAITAMAASVCAAVITCADAEAASVYTVYGIFDPEGVQLDDVDFELYKVGDINGDSFKYVNELKDVPVEIPVFNRKSDYSSEEAWRQDWMDSAAALANYLPDGYEPVAGAVTQNGEFRFDGIGNGLYLLLGESKQIWDGGKSVTWTPLPMFVMVLNGDAGAPNDRITVKPSVETTAQDFTIVKSWSDEGHEKARPSSVKVEILYDGKVEDTVTLDAGNDWSYSWHSEKTEHIWDCREAVTDEIRDNYTVDCSSVTKDGRKTMTLTNKYIGTDPTDPESPTTGDTAGNLWLYIAMCITALVLMIILVVNRKKNR